MNVAEDAHETEREFVASFARGLDIISAFTRFSPRMTLSEVASVTNTSRATARRLLLTLVREGYAEKTGRIFSLRPKVLQLGYSALSAAGMREIIQPELDALMERTRESVFTAVLTGDDVTYLARSVPDRVMSIRIEAGLRLPAYATSAGRILLASEPLELLDRHLEQINPQRHTPSTITSRPALRKIINETRELGYSLVKEELEPGVSGLSVPTRDSSGRGVAALSLCFPAARYSTQEIIEQLLPKVLETGRRIEAITAGNP